MKDVVGLDKGGIVIEKVIFKDTGELSFQVGIIQLEGMGIFVLQEEITCLRRHLELMFFQSPFSPSKGFRVLCVAARILFSLVREVRIPFSVREGRDGHFQ